MGNFVEARISFFIYLNDYLNFDHKAKINKVKLTICFNNDLCILKEIIICAFILRYENVVSLDHL